MNFTSLELLAVLANDGTVCVPFSFHLDEGEAAVYGDAQDPTVLPKELSKIPPSDVLGRDVPDKQPRTLQVRVLAVGRVVDIVCRAIEASITAVATEPSTTSATPGAASSAPAPSWRVYWTS
jgi:hypothetical protein